MRIGIDIRELKSRSFTGIGRYLTQFLSYAAGDSRNTYLLFGNQETEFPADAPNRSRHRIREASTLNWDQRLLPQALKAQGVDVFLTPYFKAPLACPCRLVVIINDLMPLVLPEYRSLNYAIKTLYYRTGLTLTCRRADRFITISGHTKSDLVRLFRVPRENIDVVHLAVGTEFHPMANVSVEDIPGMNGIRKFILFVGHLKPHKNVDGILRAYATLPETLRKTYTLVCVAQKNHLYSRLVQLTEDLGIAGSIKFAEGISEKDLPRLFNAASLFVSPSLYEGFGLPVLEAMACGTPVVTSNAASLPEVGGEAPLYVDAKDIAGLASAMDRALTDNALRAEMTRKGLEQAAKFTVETMGQKIHDSLVYR